MKKPKTGRNWFALFAHLKSGAGPHDKKGRSYWKTLRQKSKKESTKEDN